MAKNPYQGDDVDPFSGARDEESGETAYKGPSEDELERLEKRAMGSTPKKQSFGQAFAAARKAGDKTFMFGGKKFNTELAKPAAKKDPDADKGPTDAEIARLEKRAATPRVSEVKGSMKEKMNKLGVTRYQAGGSVSASKRADGCAVRGKTKGRMV
jgi:hypothetical protein